MKTHPKRGLASGAFVVGFTVVVVVALAPLPQSAESESTMPVNRDAVSTHFFPDQAPDWARVEKRSVDAAHATGQMQRHEPTVTDAIALRQTAKTQACIADRLGEVTFTEPTIANGRVDWSFRVGTNSKEPDPDVYNASRDCNEAHFQHVERALLAREAPKGKDWFGLRDDYLACVGSERSADALADRFETLGNEELFEKCAMQYPLLFEIP